MICYFAQVGTRFLPSFKHLQYRLHYSRVLYPHYRCDTNWHLAFSKTDHIGRPFHPSKNALVLGI